MCVSFLSLSGVPPSASTRTDQADSLPFRCARSASTGGQQPPHAPIPLVCALRSKDINSLQLPGFFLLAFASPAE